VTDLGTISKELKNEPESLRQSILSSMSKLKGLDLLIGANAFQRDGARLDARQRAIYKKQGLDVEDDETITNILADNITIGKESTEQTSVETPTPSPPSGPAPGQPARSRWLPWLLAGALAAGNIGAGAWLVNNLPQGGGSNDRTTIGLSTE
jgi:hypothetical protein